MSLLIESKKLKRTGYLPAFLAGGFLAAAFPVVYMMVKAEEMTALAGNPINILMSANWQMMAMLNKAIRRIIRDCNDEQFLKNENPEVLLPHFSCHSLRHTFTTRMCEAGVNVKVIQDTLGHKDISTTLNIYTDVTKELRQSEFEGLDSYFKSEYNEVSNE